MRECNRVNYLTYYFLLTPLYFLNLFLLGAWNLSSATVLAALWTCTYYFGNNCKHGVGTLDGSEAIFPTVNVVPIFSNFWFELVDKSFLWMLKVSVFHGLMVPKFIFLKLWNWIVGEVSILIMASLYPFQIYVSNYIY